LQARRALALSHHDRAVAADSPGTALENAAREIAKTDHPAAGPTKGFARRSRTRKTPADDGRSVTADSVRDASEVAAGKIAKSDHSSAGPTKSLDTRTRRALADDHGSVPAYRVADAREATGQEAERHHAAARPAKRLDPRCGSTFADDDRSITIDGIGPAHGAASRQIAETDHAAAARPSKRFRSGGNRAVSDDGRRVRADAERLTSEAATGHVAQRRKALRIGRGDCRAGERAGEARCTNEIHVFPFRFTCSANTTSPQHRIDVGGRSR